MSDGRCRERGAASSRRIGGITRSKTALHYQNLLYFALLVIIVPLILGNRAASASYDDGLEAYNRKDYAQALAIWTELAEQGDARAQEHLAGLFELGEGVEQNYVRAIHWYEKAALQGAASSQYRLGLLFSVSEEEYESDIWSYAWLATAAKDEGFTGELARDFMERMAAWTTDEQRLEALRIAKQIDERIGSSLSAATAEPSEQEEETALAPENSKDKRSDSESESLAGTPASAASEREAGSEEIGDVGAVVSVSEQKPAGNIGKESGPPISAKGIEAFETTIAQAAKVLSVAESLGEGDVSAGTVVQDSADSSEFKQEVTSSDLSSSDIGTTSPSSDIGSGMRTGTSSEVAETLNTAPEADETVVAAADATQEVHEAIIQAKAKFQSYNCSALRVTQSPDANLWISGRVASQADLKNLEEYVQNDLGGFSSKIVVEILEHPFCVAMGVFEDLIAQNYVLENPISISSSHSQDDYKEGQNLVFDITGPSFDSSVYVDYYTLDNHVVHFWPNELDQENKLGVGETRKLGQPGTGGRVWTVAPPFGRELVVAYAVPENLFPMPRPELEQADQYLEALNQALRQYRATNQQIKPVAATLFVLTGP